LNAGDFYLENCMRNCRKHKESTKQKLREHNLGKVYSDEVNKKKGLSGKSNPMFGKHHSDETKRKISEKAKSRKRNTHSEETKQKMREKRKLQAPPTLGMKFGPVSEEAKEKMRSKLVGRKLSDEMREKIKHAVRQRYLREKEMGIQRKHSPEAKQRMREAVIKKMGLGQTVVPRYNPDACKLIDEYGKLHGYNFQHAENGGEYYIKELGYWVDGYDIERNTVIEVDEAHHSRQIKKDIIRQNEIISHLGCEFIRINI